VWPLCRLAVVRTAPSEVRRDEGLSLTRKYVKRYLQTHTDPHGEDQTLMGVSQRVQERVQDMEERVMHEFEHIHNSLISPSGSNAKLDRKLNAVVTAIDRMARGKNQEVRAAPSTARRAEQQTVASSMARHASPRTRSAERAWRWCARVFAGVQCAHRHGQGQAA
jgi:hypothetical protein